MSEIEIARKMREEKKRSKNLGFPYLPAIYEAIPKKKRKD